MTPAQRRDRESADTRDVVDLRANEQPLDASVVREILESAADVIFSDGVSAEFLDQWAFETVQLLEARARNRSGQKARSPVSAGRR